ncbi:hypothetical protein [Paractinoplanes lichenicola]|uniref:Uncharacterized protein n=1 Tax=Paractinoplanes lichenicola TaxID=2802976 RepID=A0ABS1W464_9ACTN|nr:hypothetical protein [Actinoplanes lichenicola]MBL7261348.1 hypothetical protein [Actinoplanes lichenicola]
MFGLNDQHGWIAAVLLAAFPIAVVSLGVVLVAVLALAARRPRTRRHCVDILTQLTRFASVLRSRR